MNEQWVSLGNISQFKENEAIGVTTKEFGLVVVILQNDSYHVLSGICTHEEFELDGAPIQEGQLMCTLHLSAFDLTTGEVLSPPAEENLKTYESKVEKAILYIK